MPAGAGQRTWKTQALAPAARLHYMPTQAFNADYWTAIAAVGPVLALANTVTIASMGRSYLELAAAEQRAEITSGREARPISPDGFSRTYNLAWLNFGIQACLTFTALWSWHGRQDTLPPNS